MASRIDLFWQIFNSVSGNANTLTTALNGLAKADRTKLEDYFSNVIDQDAFSTTDYNRLRRFLIDLFSSHRTMTTSSVKMTDVRSLSNSDLDELFRSFGMLYSTSIKGSDENPLEQKIQFFLDLVNLYKVKGTPQSLLDVLQYFGVTNADIYEFFLKFDKDNQLIFEGSQVAGTSVNAGVITRPFADITVADPHWMYTENQIRTLNNLRKINLPSKTPYIGIKPIIQLDGPEIGIFSRIVQDQYQTYASTGILPTANATISFIAEQRSLLELYLCTLHMFNNAYSCGIDGSKFLCYDGTSTNTSTIISEFNSITSAPTSRAEILTKLAEFNTLFTRSSSENFLKNKSTASTLLQTIANDLYSSLGNTGEPVSALYALLKDIANWIKTYIGSGFIDFGFILFGLDQFFTDLRPLIEFFKPIRARYLLLEDLTIKNRLFNTIVIEDKAPGIDIDIQNVDFITADGVGCNEQIVEKCSREFAVPPSDSRIWKGLWAAGTDYQVNDLVTDTKQNQYYCLVAHTADLITNHPNKGSDHATYWHIESTMVCDSTSVGALYSRDFYDCGSAFDIGAVDDNVYLNSEESVYDALKCHNDSTSYINTEIGTTDFLNVVSYPLAFGITTKTFVLPKARSNSDYMVVGQLRINDSTSNNVYDYIITEKTTTYFKIKFSSALDSSNYFFDYYISEKDNKGTRQFLTGEDSATIALNPAISTSIYGIAINIRNTIDANPSVYAINLTDISSSSFSIKLSQPVDSDNYVIEWAAFEHSNRVGTINLTPAQTELTYTYAFTPELEWDIDALCINILHDTTSAIAVRYIVTEKTKNGFTIRFENPISDNNYYVRWIINDLIPSYSIWELYVQQFTGFNFDEGAIFDCTHGLDIVTITVDETQGFLLKEDGDYLLQEDGSRIIL